jgi:hypothetical protein
MTRVFLVTVEESETNAACERLKEIIESEFFYDITSVKVEEITDKERQKEKTNE